MPTRSLNLLLRDICRLTGADWAAWLSLEGPTWSFWAVYGLTKAQQRTLLTYLQQPQLRRWLESISASGKRSTRRIALNKKEVPAVRLFVFPETVGSRLLVVGASALTAEGRRLWQSLSEGGYLLGEETESFDRNALSELWASSYLPGALDRLLELFLASLECSAGWFSILAGESLEVRACRHCGEGQPLPLRLEMNALWRRILDTGQPLVLSPAWPEWSILPQPCCGVKARFWLGQALLIGKRPIGIVGLWLEEEPSRQLYRRVQKLAREYAPLIESSIIFADVSEHLRRLALLNDFFLGLSSDIDAKAMARRLLWLLRRAFYTERAWIFLQWREGGGTWGYGLRPDGSVMEIESAPIPENALKERIGRWSSLDTESAHPPFYAGSQSALVVRLASPQHVWGFLGVESERESAFGVYDEHFLSVIAAYFVSLLENRQLQQETEARARKLSLIHDVVEQTLGSLDVRQVAQTAAELIAKNFSYELTGIALSEGDDFKLIGVGGSACHALSQALQDTSFPVREGIVGRVLETGESLLVNDVKLDPHYLPLPGWDAGSELCVALKDGETVLGAIDVESSRTHAFTQSDVLMLESLAGILGSVIARARQYQDLRSTVDELELARLELQQRMVAQQAAETRLFQAAKLAAVGEMAAGIAHELNNPLTTVIGFTELAFESPNLPDEVRSDLAVVLQEAKRARSVVRRLLDFARQTESVRTRCDLNEIVADALMLTHHLLRTGGITVHTRYTESLPWVSVDSNQIKQVILNLVHNAMHAMPEGGDLFIETFAQARRGHPGVAVSVRDTGVGIPQENLGRVFEPFFTTRADKGGVGLGLSVSYGIIVDHGGEIDVFSQVGQGATFTIWLPVESEV
ncbi:MAG: GAF domain-containing protein [Anaerolineales bacterium]|nr:GAF domain-containing protein [Anaerolineales bacterium]